jgi:hypothetical protein
MEINYGLPACKISDDLSHRLKFCPFFGNGVHHPVGFPPIGF